MARTVSLSSDEDGINHIESFKKGAESQIRNRPTCSPASDRFSQEKKIGLQRTPQAPRKLIAVQVPPVLNRDQYIYYDGRDTVQRVRREFEERGELQYDIELVDGTQKQVSYRRGLFFESKRWTCPLLRHWVNT